MLHHTKFSVSFTNVLIFCLLDADALVLNDVRIGKGVFQCMTPPLDMTRLKMTGGGMGWGNNDFLSSLSGDSDDRDEETKKYNEFKDARESFEERQRERMNSSAGQKFMQQQNLAKQRGGNQHVDSEGNFFEDMGFGDIPQEGSASRFGSMMRQASARAQGNQPGMGNPIEFEQTFAVPLDEMESNEDL